MAAACLATAPAAAAEVVVGPAQLAAGPPQGALSCPAGGAPCLFAQTALPAAAGRATSPIDGVVVRWRVPAPAGDAPIALRVLRPRPGGTQVVASSETIAQPDDLSFCDGGVCVYPDSVPIAAGDSIGLAGAAAATAPAPDGAAAIWPAAPASGPIGAPSPHPGAVLQLSADVEPDADRDGLGDETQDLCDADAGSCSRDGERPEACPEDAGGRPDCSGRAGDDPAPGQDGAGGPQRAGDGRPSVTIAGGAAWVRRREVTLQIVPPPGATRYEVSNDASFRTRVSRDASERVLRGWRLAPRRGAGGSGRTGDGAVRVDRRTVHVRFVGPSGVLATVRDAVRMDAVRPVVLAARVSASRATGEPPGEGGCRPTRVLRCWVVELAARDAASGVRRVALAARPGSRATVVAFARRVVVRSRRPPAALRVFDGAGNASAWRKVDRPRGGSRGDSRGTPAQ